jgi:hypothetical protein
MLKTVFRAMILFAILSCYSHIVSAQIFKVSGNNLILITDSISEKQISSEKFIYCKHPELYFLLEGYYRGYQGKYIVPEIEFDKYIVAATADGWGCVTTKGKVLIKFKYSTPLTLFKNAKYFGYHDRQSYRYFDVYDRNERFIARYGHLNSSFENSVLISSKDNKYFGIISLDLDTLVPFEFICTSWDDKNFGFSDKGYIALENKDGKCGVVNHKGKVLIPFDYTYIDDVVFDVNLVRGIEKEGLIDENLNWIVPVEYDQILNQYSKENSITAYLFKDNKWSVLDNELNVHSEQFDWIDYRLLDEENIFIINNGKYGVYNVKNKSYQIEPAMEYDTIFCNYYEDNNTAAILLKDGKYSILDRNYKIHSAKFDLVDYESLQNEYVLVKLDGKYGVYNIEHELFSIDPVYDTMISYRIAKYNWQTSNPRHIFAGIGDEKSFYNENCELIFKINTRSCTISHETDLIVVEIDSKMYLMRDNGETIAGPYDNLYCGCPFSKRSFNACPFFLAELNNKFGWIKSDGCVLIPIEYDENIYFWIAEYDYKNKEDIYKFGMVKNDSIYYFDHYGKLIEVTER